jgi:hypothetical protein
VRFFQALLKYKSAARRLNGAGFQYKHLEQDLLYGIKPVIVFKLVVSRWMRERDR